MRKVFAVLTILLTLSVVLQFYLAAVGVFSAPEDELFSNHTINGRTAIPILILLTIVAAAVARVGKRLIWLSVLPLVLLLFQTALFFMTAGIFNVSPIPDNTTIPVGATIMLGFHAVNGAAIFFVCTVLIRRSWRLAFSRQQRRTDGSQVSPTVREGSPSQVASPVLESSMHAP